MAAEEPILPGGPDKVFELLERADGPEADGRAGHDRLIADAIQHYKSLSKRGKEEFHNRATVGQMRTVGAPVDMDVEQGGKRKKRKTKKVSKRKTSTRRSASRKSRR